MPRVLLFRVGAVQYGLEIEAIQEVADNPPHYRVPQAGAHLLGAVNRQGRVLPVIDLAGLLALPASARDPRLVVLSTGFHGLALAVSAVGRITAFDAADLRLPTPEEQARAIAGVIAAGDADEPIHLLDATMVIELLEKLYAA